MKKQYRLLQLPKLKKDIKDFLLSEEGKISKKDIAKIGISLAVLGLVLEPSTPAEAHYSVHASGFYTTQNGGHNSAHANHSNHSAGGWC